MTVRYHILLRVVDTLLVLVLDVRPLVNRECIGKFDLRLPDFGTRRIYWL
jgi:hypothetical protein